MSGVCFKIDAEHAAVKGKKKSSGHLPVREKWMYPLAFLPKEQLIINSS